MRLFKALRYFIFVNSKGILELYHFKKKYPNIDVEPFIKNASPFFQSFIERSLNQIALENEGKPAIQGNNLFCHFQ